MKELNGKVAVITGGGSGIGAGMALAFAEAGMHVAVADIQQERADAIAAQVRVAGVRAIALSVDVTCYESVVALADAVYAEFGAVHLLCNNAGVMVSGPMLEMTLNDWRWSYDVNVFGVIHGIHAFVPRMLAQGGAAHIVNTASMASFSIGANHSVYTSTKHACSSITEALRAELLPKGIGVSGLYPGGVASDIGSSQRNRGADYGPASAHEYGGKNLSAEQRAQMTAQNLQPIEVGRIVRQAVIDAEPWIFTHPQWLKNFANDDRTRAIKAARDAGLARQSRSGSD